MKEQAAKLQDGIATEAIAREVTTNQYWIVLT